MNFCRSAVALAALVCMSKATQAQSQTQAQVPAAPRVKYIQAGWERTDSADLMKELKTIEQTPYSGIELAISGTTGDGKTIPVKYTFTATPWKRAWFAKSVKELRIAQSPQLTDNFIIAGANPGDVDWFDDEGWKQIADHWRIVAWIAKLGGLKGIMFDPEPYAKPHAQFKYSAQSQQERHSFEEYSAKARQRGREVMEAIKSEYPDMTLFTFFMNSVNARSAGQSNPQEALKTASYNLYPAFINGWLDAAPPQMIFVDGCESAYMYSGELPYLRAANAIRNTALSLVAPENHDKYRRQVRAGFSIYLDAYINPETSRYYQKPLDGSRLNRLRDNLKNAAEATDQYIWTWGEKYRWWPTASTEKNARVNPQSWEEILPGVEDAMYGAADPTYLLKRAAKRFEEQEKAGQLVNLVKNGDFSLAGKPSAEFPEWRIWKTTKLGVIARDVAQDRTGQAGSGTARLRAMHNGVLIQNLPAQPGEYYMVRAWRKYQKNGGKGGIRVRWQDAAGKWVAESQDVLIHAPANTPPGQWHLLEGIARVPEGATELVILLGAKDQNAPDDVLWYDDVQAYRIP